MTPAQRAAAIRRGQQKALAALAKTDREGLANLADLYKQGQAQLVSRINSYANAAGYVQLTYLQDLVNSIDTVINAVAEQESALILQAVDVGAASGASVATVVGEDALKAATSDVNAVTQLQQADGLQLSTRLWKNKIHAQTETGNAVRLALVRGDSAAKAAREFLEASVSPPPGTIRDQGLASARNLSQLTGKHLLTGEGSALANAMRVFRTEVGRAHTLAYIESVDDMPEVIGYKFNLSAAHKKKDICDLHAGANLHGLGSGVYPKKVIQRIFPAHPNTTSYVTAVFQEQRKDSDKQKDKGRVGWLKGQSNATQDSILGKQKGAWLRAGKITERNINTPVKVLKKRFE